MADRRVFPVTTTRIPEAERRSQAEALQLAGGDKALTRRVDEHTVLVLNFPGQTWETKPAKKRARVKG
jgi:hypothetical protein